MADTPSYEQKTEMQFDRFIKVALQRELKRFIRDMGDEIENLYLFCELDDGQLECFADVYAQKAFDDVEAEFQVMNYTVEVRDSLLYDALSQLDERSRNVVLMWHWLEMTDQEIADETGIKRRTVNDIRRNAHVTLKNILEADGYDASSFFSKHEV